MFDISENVEWPHNILVTLFSFFFILRWFPQTPQWMFIRPSQYIIIVISNVFVHVKTTSEIRSEKRTFDFMLTLHRFEREEFLLAIRFPFLDMVQMWRDESTEGENWGEMLNGLLTCPKWWDISHEARFPSRLRMHTEGRLARRSLNRSHLSVTRY